VETAYAAIGAAFSKVGRVKDFSKTGLAFEYMDSTHQNGNGNTVDVFLMENAFHIHNLPCRVVYDVPLHDDENKDPLFKSRRCGVNFVSPTTMQEKLITTFLKNYTNPKKSNH